MVYTHFLGPFRVKSFLLNRAAAQPLEVWQEILQGKGWLWMRFLWKLLLERVLGVTDNEMQFDVRFWQNLLYILRWTYNLRMDVKTVRSAATVGILIDAVNNQGRDAALKIRDVSFQAA